MIALLHLSNALGNVRINCDRVARLLLLTMVGLSILFATVARGQELDSARQFRFPNRVPLNWENVTDSDQWLKGVKPVPPKRRSTLHLVTLQPGQFTEFLVPSHELIRVVGCDDTEVLNEFELEIWTSNGSGLYRKQVSAIADGGRSLVAAPDQSGISTSRVSLHESATCAVTLAIYTSRRKSQSLLDYYQCPIGSGLPDVTISNNQAELDQNYFRVDAGKEYSINVKGPTRLRIESRLKYEDDFRQRQTYWIRVHFENQPPKILTFDTLPQQNSRVFVDHCESLVGRKEFAYFDIEEGCRCIGIESSHSIYMRADTVGLELCRRRLNHDLKIPLLENIEQANSLWTTPDYDPASIALTQSFVQENHPGLALTQPSDPSWDPYLNHQRIHQVARDNQIHQGGLRAYMWMRAIATLHYGDPVFGDEITVSQMSARIKDYYTYFRELYPFSLDGNTQRQPYYFSVRKIRDPDELVTETIVGEQHVGDAVKYLPQVTMFDCPPEANLPLEFVPPANLGNSMLRLVLNRHRNDHSSKVFIQYDERPPFEFQLDRAPAMTHDSYVPSRAEAALSCLPIVFDRYAAGICSGAFGIWKSPAPFLEAATAEFLLPGNVQKIRVWQDSECDIQVGLQYLTSRPFRLSDLAARQLDAIRDSNPDFEDFVTKELENYTVGAKKWLAGQIVAFDMTIKPSEQINQPDDVWDDEMLLGLIRNAESLGVEQDWTGAIEQLSEVIDHSIGSTRHSAIAARIRALRNAGEHFLAKMECRGWFKYSDDMEFKRTLLDLLLEEPGISDSSRLMYLAVASVQIPADDITIRLAKELAANGKYQIAIQFLGSLIPTMETLELTLRCSLQLRAWNTFDETLSLIDDESLASRWRAQKHLHQGEFRKAHEQLHAAGANGLPWLKHWEQGHVIYNNLTSSGLVKRLKAIESWELWQASCPGETVWEQDDSVVTKSSGTRTVRHKISELAQRMHLARPDAPGEIVVYGPCRIQVSARPLHQTDSSDPIEDWLRIENSTSHYRIPIVANYSARLLAFDEDPAFQPGESVQAEIDFPTGLNRIQLSAEQSQLAFHVKILRPEFVSPVLPQINPVSIRAVLAGTFGIPGQNCERQTGCDCVRLICKDNTCRAVTLPFLCDTKIETDLLEELPFQNPELASKIQRYLIPNEPDIIVSSIDDVLRRGHRLFEQSQFDSQMEEGYLEFPEDRFAAIVKLTQLCEQYPDRSDLLRLLKKAKSGTRWERLLQFDQQAGIHTIEYWGWEAESPVARIRKALLGSIEPDFVITEPEDFVLPEKGLPENFKLTISRPRVSFMPLSTTEVDWQVNDDPTESIALDSPSIPQTIERDFAESDIITLRQANALTNHFVAINVEPIHSESAYYSDLSTHPVTKKRNYQVATTDEPLVLNIAGPTLIRVDRLERGQTVRSQVIAVDEVEKRLELAPEDGNEVALFRVFELMPIQRSKPVYRATLIESAVQEPWIDGVVESVYEQASYFDESLSVDALSLRSPDQAPVEIQLGDYQSLGLQEKGTWIFDLGYTQRRSLEEFPNPPAEGRFLEARIGKAFFDRWTNQYTRNDLFIRPRIEGGTTFGFNHSGSTKLFDDKCHEKTSDGWGPYQMSWEGYALAQNVGTPIAFGVNSTAWTTGFRLRFSRQEKISKRLSHRPTVNIFGRLISEDFDGFQPGQLDQDIFTNYKRDHRYGVTFSDRWVLQRGLDSRVWLRHSLTTNEDQLVPDNISLQFGTDQLMGPVQLRLYFRHTGYLSDNDRNGSANQSVVNLRAILEQWHSSIRRSELKFLVQHDVGDGGTTFSLNLVNFFNHRRGYRDFDTLLFRSLRQERANQHYHQFR